MIAQIDKEYFKTRPLKVWSRLISYGLFEGRPATTRGRWVNPAVFTLFRLWQNLPRLKKVEQPLFIVGAGRSGTTLLGILLSMHRQISFLNEPKALWHQVFENEDIIGSYSQGKGYYSLNDKHVNDGVVERAHKIYGAYLTVTGGKRVLDKYPELIFRIPFVKKIFPDAKFLFITRNGQDTLQSISKWSERFGQKNKTETHDWWGVNDRKWKLLCEQLISESELLRDNKDDISKFDDHRDRAATEWILTMERGLRVTDRYYEDIFTVKYENLLKDHQRVLNEILEFASLSGDKKLRAYADKIINPPKHKMNFSVHPVLQTPFNLMMEKYGYRAE